MVACVLLQPFLETGNKTWEEICNYLESARLHPTEGHWVDNLILPTLLAHHLERAEREGDSSSLSRDSFHTSLQLGITNMLATLHDTV